MTIDGAYFETQTGFGGVVDSEFDIIGAKYDTPPKPHFAGEGTPEARMDSR
jgi:hypothetical protein